jgi:hypothetical protein
VSVTAMRALWRSDGGDGEEEKPGMAGTVLR